MGLYLLQPATRRIWSLVYGIWNPVGGLGIQRLLAGCYIWYYRNQIGAVEKDMRVGYVYNPIYLEHDTGQHMENASRLEAIISHLEQTGLKEKLSPIIPRPATTEELSLAHTTEHVSTIQETAQNGGGWLDADTVMSSKSYEHSSCSRGDIASSAHK